MKKSGVSLFVVFIVLFSFSFVVAPTEESYTLSQCGNGEDDDGDGLTDYPDDEDCASISDREQECIRDAACGRYTCGDTGDCYTSCIDSSQCRTDLDVTLVCEEGACLPEDDSVEVDVCESSACGEYICDTDANECYTECSSSDAECADGYVCDDDTSTCVAACDVSTCGAYACTYNGEECETSCDSDGNCADGYYCISDSTCVEDADGDGNPDSCVENVDCSSGYVCDSGACVAYCGIGDAACSDGEDNDGDGYYDYGYCDVDEDETYDSTVDALCTDVIEAYLEVGSFSSERSPLEYCEEECTNSRQGTFVGKDPECASPLDTFEGEVSYEAPEEEQGLWARLWEFLTFWN